MYYVIKHYVSANIWSIEEATDNFFAASQLTESLNTIHKNENVEYKLAEDVKSITES